MIYGITTITMQPMTRTEYHTALLPVSIWPGGMKLRTKARSEPQKPTMRHDCRLDCASLPFDVRIARLLVSISHFAIVT